MFRMTASAVCGYSCRCSPSKVAGQFKQLPKVIKATGKFSGQEDGKVKRARCVPSRDQPRTPTGWSFSPHGPRLFLFFK